ncbi:hypothetical protein CEXT_689781 [Caerostris extrusa]|uniref:Uncharacterized protein n=1 Tax=Caerostris extrusa TaxID=172846 RepID=A0AAV4X9A6_CAEEX|nr:hypothetical protein CEXT_689781 [Caerostris extrusa]
MCLYFCQEVPTPYLTTLHAPINKLCMVHRFFHEYLNYLGKNCSTTHGIYLANDSSSFMRIATLTILGGRLVTNGWQRMVVHTSGQNVYLDWSQYRCPTT